jgi:hypothetical protein
MVGEHMESSKRGHRRGRERRMPLAGAIQVVDDRTLFEQLSLLKNHGFTPEELRTMSPEVVAQEYRQAVRKSVSDLKALFEQLSLLKSHGFTPEELRTMSPAHVSYEYAQAVREGATAGPPLPEAAERAETGATASQHSGQAGTATLSGVWPQPTTPLFQIDGQVARLLKGLLPSSRDHDELPLTDALGAIEFLHDNFLHWREPKRNLHRRQPKRTELDKIYQKATDLATDVRGCDVLRHKQRWGPENVCHPDLEALLGTLDNFIRFVAAERKRLVVVGKRGPKTPRAFVEAIIQAIEDYTGTKIERSNKQGAPAVVVRKIIEIMDPAIGSGTIDEALKARSRARGEISRQKRGEIKRRKR